jgi:DNA-binding transcriptional LysR family regulator
MSTWSGIDEFVAVAQARSFSQAAKRLGCSTSQISREVAALEDRLGQKLFYRTTRHVSLTDAGQQFHARCLRLVEERDEALSAMLEQGDLLQGLLRMTCSVAYGERFVVPLANQLMTDHPRLAVHVLLTDEVLDLTEEGIDLAVRFGRLRDSRLVASRLASRTRLLCAAPSYLAQRGTPTSLEELAHHECLLGAAEAWSFRRSGQPYLHRPHGRFRCNSGYAVLRAALSGLGLCWLPDFYVRQHLANGELVEVLVAHRPEDEGVWAVYPDRRHVPAKVKAMMSYLQQGLGKAGDIMQ